MFSIVTYLRILFHIPFPVLEGTGGDLRSGKSLEVHK